MTFFCKYKDFFGQVGKGAHSIRIFNIAIVDVVALIIVAFITSIVLHCHFAWSLIGWTIAGIIAHRLFCVRTTIDKLLFK